LHFTELVKNHYFTLGTGDKSFTAIKGKLAWFRQSCKPPLLTHHTFEKCRQIIVDERALFTDIETVAQKAAVQRNRVHDSLKNWVSTPLAFIPPEMDGAIFTEYATISDGCVGPRTYPPVEKPNSWRPPVEHITVTSHFSFGMTLFAEHIWIPRTMSSYNAQDGMLMRQLLPPRSTPELRLTSYRAGLDVLVDDWSGVTVPDATLEEKRETFLKKYPAKRRQCIVAWAPSLDKAGYRDDRAIAEVKREWLFRKPDGKNNPRIISTHHESQLLFMGPETYHEFKHRKVALFGGQDWVSKKHIIVGGMDAVKIGDIVTFNENRGWFSCESDGSRWDGRTESEGLDVEIEVWKGVGMVEDIADKLALNIDTKGRCRAGGSYKSKGKRDSGTINTSDGNGAEGHLIDAGYLSSLPLINEEAVAEYESGLTDAELPDYDVSDWVIDDPDMFPDEDERIQYQVARNGDDMMGFTSRPLSKLERLRWEQHYTNCGHKAPIQVRDYDSLEFNGGTFPRIGGGQRVWAPYIGKMCAKLFMPRQRNMTTAELENHIYGVAAGMKHYAFLPILGPILASILTNGRTAATIERDEYKCSLRDGIEVDREEVYDYYNTRYGVDVGVYDFLRQLPFHKPNRAWTVPGLEVIGRKDGVIHDDPDDLDVQFTVLDEQQNFVQQWRNAGAPMAVTATAMVGKVVKDLLPEGEIQTKASEVLNNFLNDTDVGQAASALFRGNTEPAAAILSQVRVRAQGALSEKVDRVHDHSIKGKDAAVTRAREVSNDIEMAAQDAADKVKMRTAAVSAEAKAALYKARKAATEAGQDASVRMTDRRAKAARWNTHYAARANVITVTFLYSMLSTASATIKRVDTAAKQTFAGWKHRFTPEPDDYDDDIIEDFPYDQFTYDAPGGTVFEPGPPDDDDTIQPANDGLRPPAETNYYDDDRRRPQWTDAELWQDRVYALKTAAKRRAVRVALALHANDYTRPWVESLINRLI